ncbi:hypothetical protein CMQ_7608 [Grosmannia clavigera kw1407]|uniref:Uncharacterized protein n=1 Tax=Grosmannia clavigera (strain kw1407 / UAMH 11150) TaxID=655863 RepID=F0XPX1_GROCL|nr:uncharacterized protein CMQ_7608 [Grosmannia clavigera kw1407]EFX00606.1 hypothetical protein CMQ_7608 [Grosmannia clavigera kw1407]
MYSIEGAEDKSLLMALWVAPHRFAGWFGWNGGCRARQLCQMTPNHALSGLVLPLFASRSTPGSAVGRTAYSSSSTTGRFWQCIEIVIGNSNGIYIFERSDAVAGADCAKVRILHEQKREATFATPRVGAQPDFVPVSRGRSQGQEAKRRVETVSCEVYLTPYLYNCSVLRAALLFPWPAQLRVT